MFSVIFGNISSESLNIIGASKVIGSPAAKVSTVEVPGSDLTLDFTEAFGGVHYKNRAITLTFLSLEPWDDQMAQDSTVKNALHGRKMQIIFDDDPEFYYVGRIDVGDWTFYKGAGKVEININAEPYKYKRVETIRTSEGDETITLRNSRMPVVPKITTSAEVTLAWTGHSVTIAAGTNIVIPQLVLEQGATAITITGAADVSFRYREGSL